MIKDRVDMDEFKLANFAREHPGVVPPRIKHLTEADADSLKDSLARQLSFWSGDPPLATVRKLDEVQTPIPQLDATRPDFTLTGAARLAGVAPDGPVLVNWYRFDRIDEISWTDLASYFSDFWYPSSDDIDIFDRTCEWVLSISHNGAVKVVHFPIAPS